MVRFANQTENRREYSVRCNFRFQWSSVRFGSEHAMFWTGLQFFKEKLHRTARCSPLDTT